MATNTQSGGIKILWAQATVDFASTNAQKSTDSSAITVTGAVLGNPVILGSSASGATPIDSCYTAFVSAADSVIVRFNNYSSGALDPASQVFTVGVMQLNT